MDTAAIAQEWQELVGELDECGHRLWLGPIDRRGYARFHGSLAHRLAWRLASQCLEPSRIRLRNTCSLRHCLALEHWTACL